MCYTGLSTRVYGPKQITRTRDTTGRIETSGWDRAGGDAVEHDDIAWSFGRVLGQPSQSRYYQRIGSLGEIRIPLGVRAGTPDPKEVGVLNQRPIGAVIIHDRHAVRAVCVVNEQQVSRYIYVRILNQRREPASQRVRTTCR